MLVLAAAGPLAAQSGPGADPFELPVAPVPAAGEVRNAVPPTDAYDRLRQRSATERWETLRREWLRDVPQVTYQPPSDVPPTAPTATTASPAAAAGTVAPSPASESGFRPTRAAVPQTDSASAEAFDPFQAPVGSAPTLPAPSLPSAAPGPSAGTVPHLAQETVAPRAPDFGPAPTGQPVAPAVPTAPGAAPAAPSDLPPQSPVPTVPDPAPSGPSAPVRGGTLDKPIREITPFHDYVPTEQEATFRAAGDLPVERPSPRITLVRDQNPFPPSRFHWEPTDMFHNPLYFNDTLLERYGHTFPECVQPFVSVGLFSAQLMGLPYQMAIDGVCEKRYALGYDRPGDCVPYHIPQVPLNAKAAATTAGFYTGMIFLVP